MNAPEPKYRPTQKQLDAYKLMRSKTVKYMLLVGGSRSGKTFALCDFIVIRASQTRSRHAILRFHFNDVKQAIGMDTMLKVLELEGVPYELNKSDWVFYIEAADGTGTSEIWLCGLDDKERTEKILGKEFSTIYFNEASQISYQSYQMALTRLAEKTTLLDNKVFVDCNPPTKDHWLYALFVMKKNPDNRNVSIPNPDKYDSMIMNPADNAVNLPAGYIDEVLSSLDERQRARFRDGEWLDRRQGSLWSYDMIAGNRVDAPPALQRIVVAVDPAVTANEDSDETGIIVAGISPDEHIYVLADYSVSATPATWARIVSDAFHRFDADRVIAEVNQGGDLVERNIMMCDKTLPYKQIRATRGKAIRAEPVASLYEQGKVHHVGLFPELESQMIEWSPQVTTYSPDRLDALVWAVTELTTGGRAPMPDPIFTSSGGFNYDN